MKTDHGIIAFILGAMFMWLLWGYSIYSSAYYECPGTNKEFSTYMETKCTEYGSDKCREKARKALNCEVHWDSVIGGQTFWNSPNKNI